MINRPVLISIITVTYNAGKEIGKTFESIIPHLSEEVEYIIIDGGSTDGTIDKIAEIKNNLSYWIAEKDKGIYNAMNKGIAKARGKYIYFINAGDFLISLPIDILRRSNAQLSCFPVQLSSGNIFYPSISSRIKLTNLLPHQGCFYKNSQTLTYDERFKIFADFSLNQLIYKSKQQIDIYKSPTVAYHSLDGVSHNRAALSEIFEVVELNFGPVFRVLSMIYFKFYGLRNKVNKIFNSLSEKN